MFSHDFRNPLSSILSSNSLLRNYGNRMDEERRLKHYDRIEVSIRQLIQMLDDMLVVSQMEAGSFDFRPEPMNVEAFLQQIVEEFQTIRSETYSLIFKSQFSDAIMIDPRLVRQIAANLISNAIKYSPQGSQVQVLLERKDGQVVLTVRDQGIGIPEADQARLFTAFRRASNVGSVADTGLGLAIVKQAVDLLHGTIDFESKVGEGTIMAVHMPA